MEDRQRAVCWESRKTLTLCCSRHLGSGMAFLPYEYDDVWPNSTTVEHTKSAIQSQIFEYRLANSTYVGKWLPAFGNFALVWLLAGVCSEMDGEGTTLDKPLSAILPVASVWPLVCVNAVVSLKIRLSVEALDGQRGIGQQSSAIEAFPVTTGVAPGAPINHGTKEAITSPWSRATDGRTGRSNG